MRIDPPPLQQLHDPLFVAKSTEIFILRLDKIHPHINGNKFFKLKYNIEKAKREGKSTLLTFGGAYSNHIYATAAAAKEFGLNAVGVIRGEELNPDANDVLKFAAERGMKLKFVSREEYRKKGEADFMARLEKEFGDVYIIPEGGSNEEAVRGTSEIPSLINIDFDFICMACGTGGTIAGISAGLHRRQKAVGISAVNAPLYFERQIAELLNTNKLPQNIIMDHRFHFGGYAKADEELFRFRQMFEQQHGVLLDAIYNAKLCFGFYRLLEDDFFPAGSKVVVVNTGGFIN